MNDWPEVSAKTQVGPFMTSVNPQVEGLIARTEILKRENEDLRKKVKWLIGKMNSFGTAVFE